jgi:hypothetical protein
MSTIKTSVENPARAARPAGGRALPCFAAGLVVGLGLVAHLGGQFIAGLIILAVLSFGPVAVAARRREYPQARHGRRSQLSRFFRSRHRGDFRTTPGGPLSRGQPSLGRYLRLFLARSLDRGPYRLSAQLYVDPRRRDEFRDQMQSNDVVMHFVSEIYHRFRQTHLISENARAVRDWSAS